MSPGQTVDPATGAAPSPAAAPVQAPPVQAAPVTAVDLPPAQPLGAPDQSVQYTLDSTDAGE
jgi:hypothetical protein